MTTPAPAPGVLARSYCTAAHVGERLLDLVFPRDCLACGKAATELRGPDTLRYFCEACAAALPRIHDPRCPCCGQPYFGAVEQPRVCPNCDDLNPAFRFGRALVRLTGGGRALVHELKYHTGRPVLGDIRRLVRADEGMVRHLSGAFLVPVPLHPKRQKGRGYNQSLYLAEAFVREAHGSVVMELLQRTRDTDTQTHLDRTARRKNMKNAFALTPKACIDPDARYIVVDDVLTTGATLHACCQPLRQAGAKRVDVATLAHG